jgi:hypothetical protein
MTSSEHSPESERSVAVGQNVPSASGHRAEDRAATARDDDPRREPRWEHEWERHPAQIELLQTIVLKLDRIIELLEAR